IFFITLVLLLAAAGMFRNFFRAADYNAGPGDQYVFDDANASDTEFSSTISMPDDEFSSLPPSSDDIALPASPSAGKKSSAPVNKTAQAALPATSSCEFPSSVGVPSKKIIVNEVAWMGSSSANDEWIELKNISPADVELSGWLVADSAGGIKINF